MHQIIKVIIIIIIIIVEFVICTIIIIIITQLSLILKKGSTGTSEEDGSCILPHQCVYNNIIINTYT